MLQIPGDIQSTFYEKMETFNKNLNQHSSTINRRSRFFFEVKALMETTKKRETSFVLNFPVNAKSTEFDVTTQLV